MQHHSSCASESQTCICSCFVSLLRSAAIENTEDAWVKLFMLPKCVLLTPKRGGRHHKPVSIDKLCELWSQGHIDTLWQRATSHTSAKPSKAVNCDSKTNISSAISRVRQGLLGKACRLLASSGIAPNYETTWQLLQSKHPTGPTPIPSPVSEAPRADLLPGSFDILAILRSFSKDLRVVHLAYAFSTC